MQTPTAHASPLAAYAVFHSRDLDEAREKVARVFCPHRLDRIGRGAFDACHHHLPGERLSLNYIKYGAKTLIAPGTLERFYLLQIPLEGGAMIANGTDRYATGPGMAAVLNPHHPTTMIWEESCRQVLVQIDRQSMQDHLSAVLGARADRPLTFSGAMDMTQGAGAALRQLILHLVGAADSGTPPIGQGGLLARSIESAILSGLLEAHQHNYRADFGAQKSHPAPRQVRLAEDYIQAHLDTALTLEEIATAAGVTPRSLQLAFRNFRGTTPLAFWRDQRLLRCHRDLSAGDPSVTVTDVALRWGFTHFGRFAGIYRARFGTPPNQTLRTARGTGYQD